MDLSIPGSTPVSPLTPVFGDNVQDLLGTGTLNVNPTGIITVNSIADTVDDPSSGVTTLRDAINQANGDTGSDLIVFDRSLFSNAQTIGLKLGELDITHNLDIIAPRDPLTGGDLVTVSGNNASRVFEVESGATVSLDGLIVADGNGSLTAIDDNGGGGIKNFGTLTLNNSIVRDNSTPFTTSKPSTGLTFVSGGYGGGIYNSANLTVTNSTISGNSAPEGGGGISNYGSSTVNNSTISGNSTGFGGGIDNETRSSSTVNNSTISGNSASLGGGISNSGGSSSTVNNSTISGNSASIYGGGIFNNGSSNTVNNSTISGNSTEFGGGVSDYGSDTSASVRNTIIASNYNKNGVHSDVSGTFISNGYNLIGDGRGSTGFDATGDIVGTSDNPIDPLLAPLAFNGGSTQTVALQTGSPAIGAGDPTVLDTDPTTDQRGFPRRALDGSTDIGAFEFST